MEFLVENFDFGRIHGKSVEHLKNLPALTAIHAHKNLAFIGPHGVGKTHLAMAYGRACCQKKMKAYFLKASELNERLTNARRLDKTGSMIDFLVKPSCLIIDEIGRCVFDTGLLQSNQSHAQIEYQQVLYALEFDAH